MTPTDSILVFDIGGTKLATALLLPDSTIYGRQEAATLAHEGAQAVLARLIALGHAVVSAAPTHRVAALGVASGGQIEPSTGAVVHATDNIPGWTGLPLGERLGAEFGLPTVVENDANCFALAEAVLGAGQGYRHLLVVAVGTGVGAGILIDGQLYSGWQGKAGEVGHLLIEPQNGRPCTCGQQGCLESYTATRIIVAASGYPTIHALAAAYRAGAAIPAVAEAAGWLGIGLASLAHLLGPEAIVIGGSVGLLGERYLAQVRHHFVEHAMRSYRSIPIHAAALPPTVVCWGLVCWHGGAFYREFCLKTVVFVY
ncbi:MAG: ROK family protein [Caldilineaceae bacterium]